MEPGGCRGSPPGWVASAVAPSSCADAWDGSGAAAVQGWLTSTPGGSANHGRLLVAATVVPGSLATLQADVPYSLCRVALRSDNTLTCDGCSIPACMVFNSVTIRRLPGSAVEELFVYDAEAPLLNRVVWQGGSGADCQSVPVRRSTWGAVKALYR